MGYPVSARRVETIAEDGTYCLLVVVDRHGVQHAYASTPGVGATLTVAAAQAIRHAADEAGHDGPVDVLDQVPMVTRAPARRGGLMTERETVA